MIDEITYGMGWDGMGMCACVWVCWLGVEQRGHTLQVWTGQAQRNHAWPKSHGTSLYWAMKDDASSRVWHLV